MKVRPFAPRGGGRTKPVRESETVEEQILAELQRISRRVEGNAADLEFIKKVCRGLDTRFRAIEKDVSLVKARLGIEPSAEQL